MLATIGALAQILSGRDYITFRIGHFKILYIGIQMENGGKCSLKKLFEPVLIVFYFKVKNKISQVACYFYLK